MLICVTVKVPISIVLGFVLMFLASNVAHAVVDPLSTKNNVFGIHIIDENDLEDAAKLVNGNDGEWGYVTLIIREDDRDTTKWQKIFDRMRELKLIPLVRLATKAEGQSWAKPKVEGVDSWVNFFNSLNWVIENRYVILFNEPNHSNEWGGDVSPFEYANIVRKFHNQLKGSSEDYFILPAGFDVSVPNSSTSMDAALYFKKMHDADNGIFQLFDGWNSHSYPNPAFSSSPYKTGRGGVQSYIWEVQYLVQFGLRRDTPIFITETGWVHKEGKDKKVLGFSSQTVGEFLRNAYNTSWSDPKIIAVTPFVLNYQDKPFDQFSWKKLGSNEYYPQYEIVAGIPKKKGEPKQTENSVFVESDVSDILVSDSTYHFYAVFKNSGQSIWNESYSLDVGKYGKSAEISRTKPQEDAKVEFSLNTPVNPGIYKIRIQTAHGGKKFGQTYDKSIKVISSVAVKIKASAWRNDVNNFYFDVFDDSQIIESAQINLVNGINIELKNVAVGKEYKFGLSKLYYPTKFETVKINEKENVVDFGKLIPIDLNGDGRFSARDILEGILHPIETFDILLQVEGTD